MKNLRSFPCILCMALGTFGALAAPPVEAQAPVTVTAVDITSIADKDGDYILTIKGGVASLRPFKLLTPGLPSPSPNPNPAPTLTPLQREISILTKSALAKPGATPTTGAGLSSVYSMASDAVNSGALDVSVAAEFVRLGTARVLQSQKEEAQWSDFAAKMDETITILRAQGKLKLKPEYVALFRDVAIGMNDATGFKGNTGEIIKLDPATAGILGNIDLAKIIEIIKMIIELFKLFSP